MGMVFKNIEYMNGGCFENLSGTFVPKNIGRDPPPGAAKQTMSPLRDFINMCTK